MLMGVVVGGGVGGGGGGGFEIVAFARDFFPLLSVTFLSRLVFNELLRL